MRKRSTRECGRGLCCCARRCAKCFPVGVDGRMPGWVRRYRCAVQPGRVANLLPREAYRGPTSPEDPDAFAGAATCRKVVEAGNKLCERAL